MDQDVMQFMATIMARVFHKLGVETVTLVDEDDEDIDGKTLNFSIDFPADNITKITAKFEDSDPTIPDGISLTASDKEGNKLYTERFDEKGNSVVELAPAGAFALGAMSAMDDDD